MRRLLYHVAAMADASTQIAWEEIDTVFVDMDGTLLDLAFDNFFWLELVPSRYAQLRGLDEATAHATVTRKYADALGTLPWYCLDHWGRELGLDIGALKREHRHLIRFLPMVPEFLTAARSRVRRLVVVTNAHRRTLAIKLDQTRLDRYVNGIVCAHDLDAPKESGEFWEELARCEPFDPERTLLLDDSVSVLAAAQGFGLERIVAIRRPDSRRPARPIEYFDAVDGVADLV
jgi:putative hydrolase of the HAD superfamily